MTTTLLSDIEARALAIDLYREAAAVHKLGKVTKADMAVWHTRWDAEGRDCIEHCIGSWAAWLLVGVQWNLGAADRKAELEARKAEEAARKAEAKARRESPGGGKAKAAELATEPQVALIRRLAPQKDITGTIAEESVRQDIERLLAGGSIEKKIASKIIETLLAAPDLSHPSGTVGTINQAETIERF